MYHQWVPDGSWYRISHNCSLSWMKRGAPWNIPDLLYVPFVSAMPAPCTVMLVSPSVLSLAAGAAAGARSIPCSRQRTSAVPARSFLSIAALSQMVTRQKEQAASEARSSHSICEGSSGRHGTNGASSFHASTSAFARSATGAAMSSRRCSQLHAPSKSSNAADMPSIASFAARSKAPAAHRRATVSRIAPSSVLRKLCSLGAEQRLQASATLRSKGGYSSASVSCMQHSK
mmetsp:Transcript_16887/g.42470  ORF Transcript_16887/g.42470 Transcript_16887/m.42470 type:complete len:231 (+) Transcript_16887:218-910(+)